MKKKVSLKLDEAIDYAVIAIRTVHKLHRLCHILNTHFKFDLERKADYSLELKTGTFQFPMASSPYPISESWVFLLKNRTDSAILLPEVKHTDYIFVVKGLNCEDDAIVLHAQLKTLESVEASFLLDSTKLKNVYNLLFDYETYK